MLQWCYSGVTVASQWCYRGVTVVLQWFYSGVTVVGVGDVIEAELEKLGGTTVSPTV
jgi:hypothetical protein